MRSWTSLLATLVLFLFMTRETVEMDTPASRAISFKVMSTLLLRGIEGKCFNLFAFSIQKMDMEYYKIIHKRLRKKMPGKNQGKKGRIMEYQFFFKGFWYANVWFELPCLEMVILL